VNDVVAMTKRDTLDHLIYVLPQSPRLHISLHLAAYINPVLVFLEDLKQVLLYVLKHEVEAAFALEGLLEEDDVGVLEHAKHLDLSHDRLLRDFVLIRLLELLDGNYGR